MIEPSIVISVTDANYFKNYCLRMSAVTYVNRYDARNMHTRNRNSL